ncbi:MAG: hypothetical protein AABN95_10240 [Acidobacteriota bacterium]
MSVEQEHLYQSQWWTRLAAFSENRAIETRENTRQISNERSSLTKTLASLLQATHRSSLIRVFVKTS